MVFYLQSKNSGKNISKKLNSKCHQNRLDHAKKSPTEALKAASKRANQKQVEATGDLRGNKIADKITCTSKNSMITVPAWIAPTQREESKRISIDIPKQSKLIKNGNNKFVRQ